MSDQKGQKPLARRRKKKKEEKWKQKKQLRDLNCEHPKPGIRFGNRLIVFGRY